ncbi:MAG: Rieske (2Fe-2S) protein [Gemmatimonadaceae bacterium]|jgi:Rieske Fe-S protein|nr:Rieske (2Fe-2S) protein [Gemmatimonadaceae bacterium]
MSRQSTGPLTPWNAPRTVGVHCRVVPTHRFAAEAPVLRPSDSSVPPATGGSLPADLPLLDRRGFLTTSGAAAIAALLTTACGGGDGGGPTDAGAPDNNALPTGVTRDGTTLRVDIERVATLRPTNGFVIVGSPATVIVNLGNDQFRAFTARCPHAGCLVSSVSNRRIVCNCHGSTFDADNGAVLVGPALSGLRAFPVAFASETRVLTVNAT